MRVIEVIESRRWKGPNGRTASLYGACPWTSDAEKSQWTLETVGWTWRMSNGTIGLGRVPAKTYEEAVAIMDAVNARHA